MSQHIADLTTDTFDEVIGAVEGPLLVDFWAEWCGPCKLIAPILEEIAAEHTENLSVAKVNVDDAAELAQRYHVMSIPTLLLFNNGEVEQRFVGASSKAKLLQDLSEYL